MDDGDVLCQYAQNHIYCTAPVGLINYSATLFPEPDASVANIKVAPNSSLAQKLGLPRTGLPNMRRLLRTAYIVTFPEDFPPTITSIERVQMALNTLKHWHTPTPAQPLSPSTGLTPSTLSLCRSAGCVHQLLPMTAISSR